ncbi:hypothetical protein [Nocardioides pocheonensis]|uniref:Uncharacterized protein n=1 Tax=Nocardioides pocheonensis TaxID=661485 RepID=A0A3N0GLK5_9ACTN|nr:hypothetical protein [Nocardioides pocheonensis]RNM13291.1 hypothetical protein EFL26_15880 [Nocardioides pocheonensis]
MSRMMHPGLAKELESLTEAERRLIVRLSSEGDFSPLIGRLLRGWTCQILSDQWQEAATLAGLEADRRAELDEVDLRVNGEPPPVTGKPATFDPRNWGVDCRVSDPKKSI